ncbi:MAG: CotH kinase family protein, partial [Promethearchaeota archaeon]
MPGEYSNLPEIKILCEEELDNNNMVDCTIELVCNDKSMCIEPVKAKIKILGGDAGASSYPKKGYRLKLSNDFSLLGMKKEDDWNLYGLYLDFPRMRIKFASDLWGSLEPTDPTAVSVDSEYVSLYFNGEYIGLYLLSERYNRKHFGLDDAQNNVNSSLIFQAKGGC